MTNDWHILNDETGNDGTNHPIKTFLGRRVTPSGDIGIEIEVEGNAFPKEEEEFNEDDGLDYIRHPLIPLQWNYVHDGSLRGQDNAEYVLAQPIKFDEVPRALADLWSMFQEFGSVLDESNRTSVHVHLNALDWHINRVCAFTAMYVAVEEVLTNWCGDHRVGNLFCLRAKDAPAIISKAKKFLQTAVFSHLDDGLHYAGLNLNALCKHGSIEIRTMRGVNDPALIQTWVDVLRHMYELSAEFSDPRTLCETFSGGGSFRFAELVLGSQCNRILSECGMSSSEINTSVREGIRMAQRLCYSRDWSQFQPSDTKPDPFGRKAKAATGWTHLTEVAYTVPHVSSAVFPTYYEDLEAYTNAFSNPSTSI